MAHGQTFTYSRMIDLSVGLESDAVHEPLKPKIKYQGHEGEGAEILARLFGVEKEDFELSGGKGGAAEEIETVAHAGTHVDAPWHYAPTSEGRPARKIDELPVEWFFSDGVVLDFRHKGPGEKIEAEDLEGALEKIGYEPKPLDIVLIMTGRDRYLGSPEYFLQPGLTRASVLWLCERGIKVIGIDAYSLDRNFEATAREFRETGDGRLLWEAHFAGIEREYCQIEKLANLDEIPRPHGFKVSCLPIKIKGGSGGWCRAVAFV
ncbi:putative cyclase [Rubrobacter xylanophilus DSM 9941]|uniref:Putative cyclase n=2 Tax=Rubrobacter xylanophilus TaxID=49319 RepID=Q1ATU7_RUBXD|nr:putative cyclase [Rubrobacter xylanophilus DSM 9941]